MWNYHGEKCAISIGDSVFSAELRKLDDMCGMLSQGYSNELNISNVEWEQIVECVIQSEWGILG